MSIFSKLLLLVAGTVVCLVLSMTVTGYYTLNSLGNDLARQQLNTARASLQMELDSILEVQQSFIQLLESNESLGRAIVEKDFDMMQSLARAINSSPRIDIVTICDDQGVVLVRGYTDDVGEKLLPDRASIRIPLMEGRTAAGIEPGTHVPLALMSGLPLYYEGKIVGAAALGADISTPYFVNELKQALHADFAIFRKNTRIATTLTDDSGQFLAGNTFEHVNLYNQVMDGETITLRYPIADIDYDCTYWRWYDVSGEPGGMFFVGLPRAALNDSTTRALVLFIICGLVAGALMLIAGGALAKALARPIREATNYAQAVAKGDLDRTLTTNSQDEVGSLVSAVGSMVQNLKATIQQSEERSLEAQAHAAATTEAMKEARIARERAEAGRQAILKAAVTLDQLAERLTTAAERISKQVTTSSFNMDSQLERVNSSATAMEQMNTSARDVAENAAATSQSAEQARQKAQDGASLVEASIAAIEGARQKSFQVRNSVNQLGNQADNIGSILTVINDIADQTNLLALNAAIEAARAGDAGRGFAVVADEVRKLAEKTMQATQEVATVISMIQSGTKENIRSVDESVQGLEGLVDLITRSGESLTVIVQAASHMADQNRGIATATEEQFAASEEIAQSLSAIHRASEETAAAMRLSAENVNELASQAVELKALIEEIRSEK